MFVFDTKKREAPSRAPAKKHMPKNKSSPYDGIIQRASMVGNSAMEEHLRQQAAPQSNALASESGGQELPPSLRERMEARTGMPFDDVRVHYNSDKPAHLGALAYARGSEVHIGPGQEEHLEHELGHVVQQKQGLVEPTGEIDGQPMNEDDRLEQHVEQPNTSFQNAAWPHYENSVVQMMVQDSEEDDIQIVEVEPPVPYGRTDNDGPCAKEATKGLGWPRRPNTQYLFFSHEVTSLDQLPSSVLVAFYHSDNNRRAFHIMFTKRIGLFCRKSICGANNDPDLLRTYGLFDSFHALREGSSIGYGSVTDIESGLYVIKYMTQSEYQTAHYMYPD